MKNAIRITGTIDEVMATLDALVSTFAPGTTMLEVIRNGEYNALPGMNGTKDYAFVV